MPDDTFVGPRPRRGRFGSAAQERRPRPSSAIQSPGPSRSGSRAGSSGGRPRCATALTIPTASRGWRAARRRRLHDLRVDPGRTRTWTRCSSASPRSARGFVATAVVECPLSLRRRARRAGPRAVRVVEAVADPVAAVRRAHELGEPVLVTGSLYLLADLEARKGGDEPPFTHAREDRASSRSRSSSGCDRRNRVRRRVYPRQAPSLRPTRDHRRQLLRLQHLRARLATCAVFFVVVFWLATAFWVFKDARRRVGDPGSSPWRRCSGSCRRSSARSSTSSFGLRTRSRSGATGSSRTAPSRSASPSASCAVPSVADRSTPHTSSVPSARPGSSKRAPTAAPRSSRSGRSARTAQRPCRPPRPPGTRPCSRCAATHVLDA